MNGTSWPLGLLISTSCSRLYNTVANSILANCLVLMFAGLYKFRGYLTYTKRGASWKTLRQ